MHLFHNLMNTIKKKKKELACDDGLNLNGMELSLTSDLVLGPPSDQSTH